MLDKQLVNPSELFRNGIVSQTFQMVEGNDFTHKN